MRIGILIPTYNRKKFLARSVASAVRQTHTDLEVLVIDDHSDDGTAELIAELSDPRLRYIYNARNAGLIENINRGIDFFSNEVQWCMILCDDDILDNDCIAKLVKSLMITNAKTIIHSHRIFVDEQDNIIGEATVSPQEETALHYLQERAIFWRQTYITGVLFNRKAFDEVNGYPRFSTGLAADDAFIFALSLKDRLVFEPDAVSYIRLHEGAESIISSGGIKKLHTLEEFKDYCYKTVMTSGAFGKKELRRFKWAVEKYLKSLNSAWWIQTASDVFRQKDKDSGSFAELLSLVKDDSARFSLRVKCDTALLRHAGVYPEVNRYYRLFWTAISEISHFFDIRIRHPRVR